MAIYIEHWEVMDSPYGNRIDFAYSDEQREQGMVGFMRDEHFNENGVGALVRLLSVERIEDADRKTEPQRKENEQMDKLSEHAIRMLEIEGKGKNDGYIETRNMGDIARAVYDTILQVQMLKTALLHKTEPTISKMEQVDKPQTELVRVKYHCINCAENGSYKCSKCDGEMYYKYDKDEPQTDCAWKKGE